MSVLTACEAGALAAMSLQRHQVILEPYLIAANSLDKCQELHVVINDQAAQRVLHYVASQREKSAKLAETVGLVVALIEIVPAFAYKANAPRGHCNAFCSTCVILTEQSLIHLVFRK